MIDAGLSKLLLMGLPFAFVVSLALTRILLRYLVSLQILDKPNHRSMHAIATPRGGGLAFVLPVILFAVLIAIWFNEMSLIVLVLCLSVWGLLGFWDDIKTLSPKLRFFLQLLLSLLMVWGLGAISDISFSSTLTVSLLAPLAWLITVLGVVWFVNLYNFMDGMDGLATSQAIVALVTLAAWFYADSQPILAYVCLLCAASCAGFLVFNWSPAKIFMGDIGSLALGAFFAYTILRGVNENEFSVLSFVLLFWVFICDTSVTLIRRIFKGEKVWQAHRQHYYQRLAATGMAHDKVVVLHLLFMIISSLLASISVQYPDRIVPMLALSVTASVCLFGLVTFCEKRKNSKL
jgi:Fuc2NAc and GlcNAc transferase